MTQEIVTHRTPGYMKKVDSNFLLKINEHPSSAKFKDSNSLTMHPGQLTSKFTKKMFASSNGKMPAMRLPSL